MTLPIFLTNILQLTPLDGPNTTFVVPNNATWVDQLYFGQPGFGPTVALAGCALTGGSNVISVLSTSGIQLGMMISPAPGLPNGGYVGSITSSTQLTCVDGTGLAVNATGSMPSAFLTFMAPPLSLVGIIFIANLRKTAKDTRVWLTAQTGDNSMINQGTQGLLSFNVPIAQMGTVPADNYVMDILASGDGYTINLMAGGPSPVTITGGISDVLLQS